MTKEYKTKQVFIHRISGEIKNNVKFLEMAMYKIIDTSQIEQEQELIKFLKKVKTERDLTQ